MEHPVVFFIFFDIKSDFGNFLLLCSKTFTLMPQTPVITAVSASSVEQMSEIGVFSLKLNGR